LDLAFGVCANAFPEHIGTHNVAKGETE